MKEPSEYLNLAKEKVATANGYADYETLCKHYNARGFSFNSVDEKAALLALQLQQEDAEKHSHTVAQMGNDLFNQQIREEKAKAFDEGAKQMQIDCATRDYESLVSDVPLPLNPYKQDTQPKDK